MENTKIRETRPEDSDFISSMMKENWGGEPLVIRGKNYFPSKLNGMMAYSDEELVGFLFYDLQGTDCEIIVFEVFEKFKGIGTQLLNYLKEVARKKQCHRIYLMTNNDNLDALRFYQRRGFTICGIHINSVEISRKMKPGIPEIGEYGIPLRDEIDLEFTILQNTTKEHKKNYSHQKNQELQFVLESLAPLIQALNKEIKVAAVLCYGSYAEGTQDEKSDIDLLVICDEPIPAANIRNKNYEKYNCEEINLQKFHKNWETTWTPINDEFVYKGKKIEIGYNLSTWANEVVKKIVEEGKTTLENFQFRPYTFLALLENSICLFEKKNYVTNLRKQIRPFPSKLKAEIINENLSIFDESLEDLEDFSQRDIGLLAFQFMLFRGIEAAIQIIFAINEVYYPSSKREEKHLMRLSKLPEGMHELIYDLLPTFFNRKKEILMRLKDIKIFIEKEKPS